MKSKGIDDDDDDYSGMSGVDSRRIQGIMQSKLEVRCDWWRKF
jgi:outer membrane scaffolding protein for murein synthesis (MipA/OmpV family)